MTTTFRPADSNFNECFELNVSVFNRRIILQLLNINNDEPVGRIELNQIDKLLERVEDANVYSWPLAANVTDGKAEMYRYRIMVILAYCLGKGCGLQWA